MVEGLIRRLIAENAQVGLDPDDYARRETELLARYDAAKSAMTNIENQIQERKSCRTKLTAFIRALEKQDGLIATFDEQLWNTTVESVKVYSRTKMKFTFIGSSSSSIRNLANSTKYAQERKLNRPFVERHRILSPKY